MADITFSNFEEHKVKTDESIDSLAKQHAMTWKQLSQFNWATSEPKHINECLHDLVGCKHKTKDGKNYIFTSNDDPGIIYAPVKSSHYQLQTGRTHRIQVNRPHLKCTIEVETVDDFLHVVPNVTLTLKRKEGGPEVEITSDEHGYGTAKVLSGHYQVTVKGGGPAYFLSHTDQPENDDPSAVIGTFDEAVIDTRQRVETLTQLVVARIATPTQKRERRLLQNVYTRTGKHAVGKIKARGTETSTQNSSEYTRLDPTLCVDNLALIAGWTNDSVDISSLVSSVLPDFFQDRDGAPSGRNYFVWVVEAFAKSPRLSLYNASGSREASFKLTSHLHGHFGAYSLYETKDGQLFVDMMTKTYTITEAGRENQFVELQKLVAAADQQKVIDAQNAHAGKAAILYFLPTLGQLAWIGVHGGSGRLEDYGNQETVNKRIHERNKTVCQNLSILYNGYIDGYIARVKKTRNEKELRQVGPPWAPYVMPPPADAKPSQKDEIYSAYDFHQLRAWEAVSVQLDKFAKRMSEGFPYIVLKAKYEIGGEDEEIKKKLANGGASVGEALPVSFEVEGSLTFQFTNDEIRTLAGHEEQAKLSKEGDVHIKGTKYALGLEYKRSLEKPENWEVTIKTGPLELEVNKEGNRKIALEALPEVWAESQFNPNNATFEGGLKIETKAILEILEKIPLENKDLKEFCEKYGKKIVPKEISIHAGMVGLRQETVLALVSNAPGFFERRDLEELVKLPWNALTLDEQVHLTQLGWDLCSWDLKSYADAELPKTMEEEWDKFSPQQQVAMIHLGFYNAEDYHEDIEKTRTKQSGWKDALEKLKCSEKENREDDKSSAAE